ncbi:efflux RND transporter periplasmic adaptor subunit [Acidipila sp. EB88]|uniref:efflux RND transporter periplasmic adaptor subunit n=1 Tax=Acidipila sp. EB88 TaxID=2305226 RepID=UPI001F3F4E5F|nr:efflux RND transporter periplasmic adaptor subunit [Acidipila sp. EB88]
MAVAILIALAAIVGFTVHQVQSGYTKVLLGTVERGEVEATVSGTGQVKPKTYVNIGATAFGRITHLYVKEGDHVHRGQILATVENVQPEASVAAQRESISSAKTDITSYVAAEQTAQANIEHAQADLEQKKLDFDRYRQLYNEKLVSKQEFDARKAALDLDVASLAQSNAALNQAKAQTDSARGHLGTAVATLRSDVDALSKTVSVAPYDGIVTNLPVREGETMVIGIQNAEGSTLMTIADMSVVTAEVKIDETDIVNVHMGQPVNVTVDALPDKILKGHVTEVGDQALLRSSGVATSQSTSGTEEAKDFKVIVTLDGGQDVSALRPGLSATARIVTADHKNVLAIPIQALCPPPAAAKPGNGEANNTANGASGTGSKEGVFVVRKEAGKLHAHFVPLTTGVSGASNMEVSGAIHAGDQIVTGTYKVLRVLKENAAVKAVTAAELATSDSATP